MNKIFISLIIRAYQQFRQVFTIGVNFETKFLAKKNFIKIKQSCSQGREMFTNCKECIRENKLKTKPRKKTVIDIDHVF
jgi:hypothetical protein